MINLPYLLAGVARRYAPEPLLFLAMKLRGHGNLAEEAPDATFAGWLDQLRRSRIDLVGRHVVEIGSGRYGRVALRLLAAGARRVTLVDFYALPLDHPDQRETLMADCAALGLAWDAVLRRVSVTNGDIMQLSQADLAEPADLVFSHAVLEHVRDPEAILRRCHEWLRPGGTTFHMVDLRDHNFHFRYPFEMLAYSDRTWSRWIDLQGGFHVNRWRAHDHLRAIAAAGFVDVTYDSISQNPSALRAVVGRLDRRFQGMPPPILAIERIYLYGRRAPA